METEDIEKIISWCETRTHKPELLIAKPKEREFGLDIIPYKHNWS